MKRTYPIDFSTPVMFPLDKRDLNAVYVGPSEQDVAQHFLVYLEHLSERAYNWLKSSVNVRVRRDTFLLNDNGVARTGRYYVACVFHLLYVTPKNPSVPELATIVIVPDAWNNYNLDDMTLPRSEITHIDDGTDEAIYAHDIRGVANAFERAIRRAM